MGGWLTHSLNSRIDDFMDVVHFRSQGLISQQIWDLFTFFRFKTGLF